MREMGLSPGLPPLLARVPAETRPALQKLIDSAGIPTRSLDRMATWAAAMSLSAGSFRGKGFKAEAGVAPGLSPDFRDTGKAISGRAPVEQRCGISDRHREGEQK